MREAEPHQKSPSGSNQDNAEVAVFCVGSPLQLICALEAKAWLGCRENILVIREPGRSRQAHRQQMARLVQAADWRKILSWEPGGGTDLIGLRKASGCARRLARQIGSAAVYVLGGFGQLRSQMLRNHLKPLRTIVIDDGTSTLQHLEHYYSRGKGMPDFMESIVSVRGARSWLKRQVAELNAEVLSRPVELFTGFDIGAEQAGSVQIHRHRFEELKRRRADVELDPRAVWYFGSPLSERGILPLGMELEALQRVAGYYAESSLSFVYLTHRDDSAEKIEALRKQGVLVKTLDVPAEVHFATADKVAAHVASSVSTALFNVSCIIDGVSAEAFPVTALVEESGRPAHERVTAQYRKLGIRVNDMLLGLKLQSE